MATVLWCLFAQQRLKKDKDYHVSADLTGQANHLGVTIERTSSSKSSGK